MKLTPHQIALLREASKYSLMELGGKYYRLGGHGNAPLRLVRKSRIALQQAGLLAEGSTIKTTELGKTRLFELDAS